MSTRATYTFKNSKEEWAGNTTIYIHYDGYPEGAASYFWAMLHAENQRGDFATMFIRANELAEITGNHRAHGDTNFWYTLDGETLTAYEVRYNTDQRIGLQFFKGFVYDFINTYGCAKHSLIENFEPFKQVKTHRYSDRRAWLTRSQITTQLEKRQKDLDEYRAKFPDSIGNIRGMQGDVEGLQNALAEYDAA